MWTLHAKYFFKSSRFWKVSSVSTFNTLTWKCLSRQRRLDVSEEKKFECFIFLGILFGGTAAEPQGLFYIILGHHCKLHMMGELNY